MLVSTNNFDFWNKFPKKSILPVKNTHKNEHHYGVPHIKISLSTNFSLNWQLQFFGQNFPKKGSYFQSKTHKINTAIEFCIFELLFV